MTALALGRAGIDVTVLERSQPDPQYGGGLAVDGEQLAQVTGVTEFRQHTASSAYPAPWTALRRTLREAADQHPRVTLHHGTRIVDVGQDAGTAWAVSGDSGRFDGDVLLGADGHRSLVRRRVAPERPDADFAGYVIWLGMVDEEKLDYPGHRPSHWDIMRSAGDILFGVPAAGPDGSLEPGRGRIGWAWYDRGHNRMLRETGAVVDGVVQHSVRPGDVPQQTLDDLKRAAQRWPRPWRDAIVQSIADREVLGTPIAEYVPLRLVSGRLAILGNAAHVPTPMTGQGFDASLRDAETLARVLEGARPDDAPDRLAAYQRERLEDARRLVMGGQRFSRSFAAST
ncbi:FAD-dependent monooxygenase [Microbacterium sp. F51-2R]|uniref:FAD-dependent monooxygenase n=1 Tax=Microbacterium sp. F51-2R TaxID=3445777 RepID=UPI003FA07202